MLSYKETLGRVEYNIEQYFTLGNIIDFLEAQPNKEQKVPIGFFNPHSYRGYYHDLAFEPVKNTTIEVMLYACNWANGKDFQGYKGGWFKMDRDTDCWIAYQGRGGGEKIGQILLTYMCGGWKQVGNDR